MHPKHSIVINLLNSNRSRAGNWCSALPEVAVKTSRYRGYRIAKVDLTNGKIFLRFYHKTYFGQPIVPA